MKTLSKILKAFWQEESGLTMVEYAVAGFLVAASCVLAFTALGTQIGVVIQGIVTTLGG
jgi:pilus assembly protein Flp/PilA